MVGEDLDFQMACARQIFFKENGRVTEGGARFTLRFFEEGIELRGVMDDAHAAAAPAHRRFHDDGIADLPSNFLRLRWRLDGIFSSGKDGNACQCSESSSGCLVSKQLKKLRRGTNESDAGLFAGARKRRILGKKTVTGMDGVDALFFCQGDDSRDVQVGFHGAFADANLIGFIGLKAMQRKPVFLRIDGYGAQAELIGCAEDADGDFAAICADFNRCNCVWTLVQALALRFVAYGASGSAKKRKSSAFTSEVAPTNLFSASLSSSSAWASSFKRYFPGPVFSPVSKLLLGKSSLPSRTSVNSSR